MSSVRGLWVNVVWLTTFPGTRPNPWFCEVYQTPFYALLTDIDIYCSDMLIRVTHSATGLLAMRQVSPSAPTIPTLRLVPEDLARVFTAMLDTNTDFSFLILSICLVASVAHGRLGGR